MCSKVIPMPISFSLAHLFHSINSTCNNHEGIPAEACNKKRVYIITAHEESNEERLTKGSTSIDSTCIVHSAPRNIQLHFYGNFFQSHPQNAFLVSNRYKSSKKIVPVEYGMLDINGHSPYLVKNS